MASNEAQGLFRLAAELRAELSRIDRTVSELEQAAVRLGSATGDRLVLYGAAALLETFYTGIEKGLTRVALAMGGLPSGATWHRTLLEDMTLSIPQTRPAVLRRLAEIIAPPCAADPSRAAALLVGCVLPVRALLAPCRAGASTANLAH